MKKRHVIFSVLFICIVCLYASHLLYAEDGSRLSDGQTIYVPAYSHIYSGVRGSPFLLTVTISIRNIDPKHEIIIKTVDYYETKGVLLKKYIDKPVILKPLESLRFIRLEKDSKGGSGANFIVEWNSKKRINAPIVESVMIGTKSGQGISFSSRGRAIYKSEH